MWPSHKTLRKGWWCRAFATAINRQCPTCNRLWTTEQFPPSLTQCLACSRLGTKKKPSQFKLLDSQVGLIFRSALPEELEWENRAEDVALSLDAIKRCVSNMLTALDRDIPQTKNGLAPHNLSIQEIYHYPGATMALVHAPGVRIPPTHGRISQTNTPRNRGIHAKVCLK